MWLDAGGPHDIGDLLDLSSNERLELGGGAAERNDANAGQPLACPVCGFVREAPGAVDAVMCWLPPPL